MGAHDDSGQLNSREWSGDIERWYQVILNASRKRLTVEPGTAATIQLWRGYRDRARRLWKRAR